MNKNYNLSQFDDILSNQKSINIFKLLTEILQNFEINNVIYNPVLLVGNSGTGKTFILQKILEILDDRAKYYHIKDLEFLYDSSAFIKSMEEMSKYSCIMIDAVHLLYDNEKAQEELIFLIEKLVINKTLLFLTISEENLKKDLTQGLKNHLNMGLILKLIEPDLEIKLRYVKICADNNQVKLTKEQSLHLARKCEQFRSIQSCIINVKAFFSIMQMMPDFQQLDKIIINSGQHIDLTYEKIINIVGKYFGYSVKELKGNKRYSKLVEARQIAMFLCRNLLGLSFMEIGTIFNGKDHTTVIYSVRKIEEIIVSNKDMHNLVTEVTNRCKKNLI